jgi:hypothetical protein
MTRIANVSALAIVVATMSASCDKVPLMAPTGSTVTLSANATTVPTNGTVGLTAFVMESSGTPVQNGTTVRFTTTLGTVTPADAQTSNGIAVATFNAGDSSGVAVIHAISGGATGGSGTSGGTGGTGTGTTTTVTAGNMVTITVGVAAAKTLTITASPTSVGPNGGSVNVTAMVLDASGGSLAGIPVTFSSDHGNVNPGTVLTDSGGQATSTLTTSVETKVTASAGAATGTATVTLRAAPAVTVKCTPASGTGTCASVAASDSSNTATVTFDVAKATGSSTLRDVTINFGDGTSQSLGTLAGGTITVAHSYPGSSNTATYTAVVTATDLDNERSTVSTIVNVTPRSALTIDLAATQSSSVAGQGQSVALTATVAGGTAQSFAWDFDGDGTVDATTSSSKITHIYTANGRYTAVVTVQTIDGRSATARTEFIVTGI